MPPVRRMAAAALPAADSGSVACTPVGSVRTGGGPGCRPGAFGARSEGTGGFHESQIKIGILFNLCKFKEKMLADCYRKCRFLYFFVSTAVLAVFWAGERCDAPLRRVSERLSGRPDAGANVGRDAVRDKAPMGGAAEALSEV